MRVLTTAAAAIVALFVMIVPLAANAQDGRADWLDIELGKSVVLETPANATAIAITDPAVADVVTLATARKLQVQGVSVGSTDLVIQLGPGSAPIIYEITVHRDLSDLIRRVEAIVDGDPPRVFPLNGRIVVQGDVDDLITLEHVAQVSRLYDEEFVNLMTVTGDHQVQLDVVFAEVNRSAFRELGINALFGDPDLGVGSFNSAAGSTQNGPLVNTELSDIFAQGAGIPGTSTSNFNLIGWVGGSINLGAVLSVLDDHKLSKVLAQPSLVALSGQQAEFLAGGEIPIATPNATGNIRINYKEYGIKLVFVPTVLGGTVIDMRVYVEVSDVDFSSSSQISGISVPGFTTRKSQSHVRVDSGMTFALAGLLSETSSSTVARIPLLGDIPLVGSLFRYVRHQRDETELMIFVTPRLVRPLGPGEVPAPPGTTENHNPNDIELFLLGLDSRPGSRTAQPTGDVGLQR